MTYETDVEYEVWRSGGNPDRVDRDRVADYRDGGYSAEEAAGCILRRQHSVGPNVVDDCEGMTEEEYYRGMEEAMFGQCGNEADEEELAANKCKSCGKALT